MKKLFSVLIICILLASCSQKSETPAEPEKTPVIENEPVVSEAYKEIVNNKRPLAIMIDNDDKSARPQTGLEKAYIIYEIIVEGGSTRFMALFKDYEVGKIGPVRSSRHYFLDYVLENDAIYAHSGWSPKAQRDISSLGVKNINGIIGTDGKAFYRDNTYNKTWHNLYTKSETLEKFAKNKGYSLETDSQLLSYNENKEPVIGEDAENISFKYSYLYTTSYKYNKEKGVYEKYINNTPHKMQNGEVLDCENVIAYKISNFNLNDGENKGRQDLSNIGSGEGFLFSDGKCVKIKWSKTSRSAKTIYTDENGNEITLNPGRTFINIVPKSGSISY